MSQVINIYFHLGKFAKLPNWRGSFFLTFLKEVSYAYQGSFDQK